MMSRGKGLNAREIRFGGSGGQGLQLSAKILASALNREGMMVAQSQSYEPTSRGGFSRSDLIFGPEIADYPLVTRLDFLVALDQLGVDNSRELLDADSRVLVDATLVRDAPDGGTADVRTLAFSETATRLGNKRVANIVALGALIGLGDIVAFETLKEAVSAGVPARFLDLNLEALERGYQMTAENRSPAEQGAA